MDDLWATKSEDVGLIVRAIGYDPPTSQTDGQTDDMRSQNRALHYSASRGKQWRKPIWFTPKTGLDCDVFGNVVRCSNGACRSATPHETRRRLPSIELAVLHASSALCLLSPRLNVVSARDVRTLVLNSTRNIVRMPTVRNRVQRRLR